MGSEMLFNRTEVVEGGWIFLVLCSERDSFSFLVLPLLHDLRIICDLNGAPVIVEPHPPTEPLLVERPKGGLESVIVGGSKNLAGQSTPSNGRIISFNRLFFTNLGLGQLVFLLGKSVSLQST